MSNKSSIECLMIQLYEQGLLKGDGNKMDELFEQAKEMHKQEIENSWKMGRYDSDKIVMSEKFYAEEYYDKTFGK